MISIVGFLTVGHTAGRQEMGERPFWLEWGATYARRLFAGVARHVTEPYEAFLVTDTPSAAPAGVTALVNPLTPDTSPGWWGKLGIFAPGLLPARRTLYLDLDNVVAGPLTELLTLDLGDAPLAMLDDHIYPRMLNGAVMLCDPHRLSSVYTTYVQHPRRIQQQYSKWPHASDQAYIAARCGGVGAVPMLQDRLPPGYILNSRAELERGADWSRCQLVYGSWDPKPHQSKHPFYRQHWTDE